MGDFVIITYRTIWNHLVGCPNESDELSASLNEWCDISIKSDGLSRISGISDLDKVQESGLCEDIGVVDGSQVQNLVPAVDQLNDRDRMDEYGFSLT
jgi:hypothetical protein